MNTTNNHSQNMSIENMPTSEPSLQGNVRVGPSSPRGNEEKPILTIIIPTYNMEKYLRHCLDSLIVPNMDKVEVLVINDGSKDSSSAIGHEYQDKYPQTFRVIDKENGNYGSCVNRGLKEATGKYIKVLDADDWFNKEAFGKYVNELERHDEDLIITNFSSVRDGSVSLVRYNIPQKETLNMDVIKHYPSFIHIQMHAVTYKTINLRSIGYRQTEGISYTDQEWMFLPMTTVKTFYYYPENIYQYLLGREGQTEEIDQKLKHLSQIVYIQKEQLEVYTKLKKAGNDNFYLRERLKDRFKSVYEPAFIFSNNVPDLIDFDKYLKSNYLELYTYTDDNLTLKYVHYHYVRKWRKNYKISKFNIFRLLFSLKNSLSK